MAIQAKTLQAQVAIFQQKDPVEDQMGRLLFPEHRNSTLHNRYENLLRICYLQILDFRLHCIVCNRNNMFIQIGDYYN